MRDEDGIYVQFCYLPDYSVFGQVLEAGAHYYRVKYTKHHIEHNEIFNHEDVILMKEVHIPFEREVDE